MSEVADYRLPPEPPAWVCCGMCGQDVRSGEAVRFDDGDGSPERWVCLADLEAYGKLRYLAAEHPEMWDSPGSVSDLARWYECTERAVRWAAEGVI